MAEALTNQAYEYLYQKIVSCEYLPGQELNEKQLLEETSFGRTPLREALLMLQAENLIDIFPRKGMRITPFTEKNIDDLYQTRKLIEPTVCRKYLTMYSKNKLLEFQKQFEKAENDSVLMENYTMDDIDAPTLAAYRNRFRTANPDHVWNEYSDREFLLNMGGYIVDRNWHEEYHSERQPLLPHPDGCKSFPSVSRPAEYLSLPRASSYPKEYPAPTRQQPSRYLPCS